MQSVSVRLQRDAEVRETQDVLDGLVVAVHVGKCVLELGLLGVNCELLCECPCARYWFRLAAALCWRLLEVRLEVLWTLEEFAALRASDFESQITCPLRSLQTSPKLLRMGYEWVMGPA